MSTPLVLERVTRTALLGVRFWDRATGRAIADGLELTEVSRGTRAVVTRGGVFAFHDLPGLRASAFGAGDAGFWTSPPASRAITLQLTDRERRFLPFRLDAVAPTRGVLAEDCGLTGSPPAEPVAAVPLFSAPSRLVPSGLVAVRADLWDLAADAPAAWAVLEATPAAAPTCRGVADADGRVAVVLPYPEPPWAASSPPPGSSSLLNQTWPLDLAVRYAPGAASPPLPDPSAGIPPDLCAVLTQPPATLLSDVSPLTPLTATTLAFGRELVLRTPGRSVLLVAPA